MVVKVRHGGKEMSYDLDYKPMDKVKARVWALDALNKENNDGLSPADAKLVFGYVSALEAMIAFLEHEVGCNQESCGPDGL